MPSFDGSTNNATPPHGPVVEGRKKLNTAMPRWDEPFLQIDYITHTGSDPARKYTHKRLHHTRFGLFKGSDGSKISPLLLDDDNKLDSPNLYINHHDKNNKNGKQASCFSFQSELLLFSLKKVHDVNTKEGEVHTTRVAHFLNLLGEDSAFISPLGHVFFFCRLFLPHSQRHSQHFHCFSLDSFFVCAWIKKKQNKTPYTWRERGAHARKRWSEK